MKSLFKRSLFNRKGQTAVEYGLILAGVTMVIFLALNSGLSAKFKTAFDALTTSITNVINPPSGNGK